MEPASEELEEGRGDMLPAPGGRVRWLYLACGWLCFSLGLLGALLPIVPTTPFMLLALWAFSRSSHRFHHWLYNHRVFGQALRSFQEHRVVPLRIKLAAALTMAGSYCWLFFMSVHPSFKIVTALVMLSVLAFLFSCPSKRP